MDAARPAPARTQRHLGPVDWDALTVLKLLYFQEQIHVYVADGELKTEHSFYLAGQRFLTLLNVTVWATGVVDLVRDRLTGHVEDTQFKLSCWGPGAAEVGFNEFTVSH